jgi:hypothetical protein
MFTEPPRSWWLALRYLLFPGQVKGGLAEH